MYVRWASTNGSVPLVLPALFHSTSEVSIGLLHKLYMADMNTKYMLGLRMGAQPQAQPVQHVVHQVSTSLLVPHTHIADADVHITRCSLVVSGRPIISKGAWRPGRGSLFNRPVAVNLMLLSVIRLWRDSDSGGTQFRTNSD